MSLERSGASYAARSEVFAESVGANGFAPTDIAVHPETGDPGLLLGGFARPISGLSTPDAAAIKRTFQDYITLPENTVRWRWQVGDLIIWDNRATQHYAIADYGNARRRGERVTVAGPVPVGVDGRPSVAIKGNASAYYAGGV